MTRADRRTPRRGGLGFALLAVLLQVMAGAVLMPASAAPSAALWPAGSFCGDVGDGPALPGHHAVCPICFVAGQSAGGIPQDVAAIAAMPVCAVAQPAIDCVSCRSATSGRPAVRAPPAG